MEVMNKITAQVQESFPRISVGITNATYQGPPGPQGETGMSAYEQAIAEGFEGTFDEWIESLRGRPFTFDDFTAEELESLKGQDGKDGTSATLQVQETDKGVAIIAIDATGTTTGTIKHGAKGEKGDPFRYEDFSEDQIEALKIKGDTGDTGPKGDTGDSGVYIGTEAPDDPDKNVWINPDGDATPPSDGGDVDLSDYYTKQQVDKLISDNKITTFEYTTINNISYLEDIKLPCCLRLVNSWLGGMFFDDIVYVKNADEMIRVFTIDNVMYELNVDPDGSLHVVLVTNISDEIDAVKGELEAEIAQSHNPTWVAWCEDDNVLSGDDGPLSAHIVKIDLDKFSRVPELNERGLLVSRNRWNEYRLCYCHVGWFEEERAVLYVDYTVRVDRHDLYTKDEVDALLEDNLITIKDTEVTNISQLPMDKLPCCLHMINSTFFYEFNDDIVYVNSVPGFMVIWTMDGQIAYLTYNDDGEIIATKQDSFVYGTFLTELFYNKDEVDQKIADAIAAITNANEVSY